MVTTKKNDPEPGGFWDANPDLLTGGGGEYVGADEKEELMEDGVPFPVTSVAIRENPFEKDSEQYVVAITLPDSETGEPTARLLTFTKGAVESRDRTCDRMAKYLEDPANEPPVCQLEKVGRSIILRPAG